MQIERFILRRSSVLLPRFAPGFRHYSIISHHAQIGSFGLSSRSVQTPHLRVIGNAPISLSISRIGSIRTLFIQTEETPNPSSLKFLPGEEVLPAKYGTAMEFKKNDNMTNSSLARRIFRLPGVESVMFAKDFIAIRKNDEVTWSQLKPEVFACLMDYFQTGKPAVTGAKIDPTAAASAVDEEEDDEIVVLIKELLEERIRPMVQEDGGDIFFKSYDAKSGVVTVKMAGSCDGCPSSTVTLKNGVENMLMHYIPEVTRVDQHYEDAELNERKLHFEPSV